MYGQGSQDRVGVHQGGLPCPVPPPGYTTPPYPALLYRHRLGYPVLLYRHSWATLPSILLLLLGHRLDTRFTVGQEGEESGTFVTFVTLSATPE